MGVQASKVLAQAEQWEVPWHAEQWEVPWHAEQRNTEMLAALGEVMAGAYDDGRSIR